MRRCGTPGGRRRAAFVSCAPRLRGARDGTPPPLAFDRLTATDRDRPRHNEGYVALVAKRREERHKALSKIAASARKAAPGGGGGSAEAALEAAKCSYEDEEDEQTHFVQVLREEEGTSRGAGGLRAAPSAKITPDG